MRTVICAVIVLAGCWPAAAACDDDVMGVGFQFSATSPQGPDGLTDLAKAGVHFRTFYNVAIINDNWRVVGEFGYNSFGLRRGEFADLIGPSLADSITALFPMGPSLPEGSVARTRDLTVQGGEFNAMHVTGGVQYMFDMRERQWLRPYVTAQGGLYSTGQSDTDVAATFDVERPAMADTTLNFPQAPFIRDDDRDNAFGMSFGGGAEISLMDFLALGADFRYHMAFTEPEKTTFIDVGLGLIYYLGF